MSVRKLEAYRAAYRGVKRKSSAGKPARKRSSLRNVKWALNQIFPRTARKPVRFNPRIARYMRLITKAKAKGIKFDKIRTREDLYKALRLPHHLALEEETSLLRNNYPAKEAKERAERSLKDYSFVK